MSAIVGITKLAAGLVVSTGVGTIVGNVLRNTVPADAKLVRKISTYVGAAALSAMVANQATVFVEGQIDGYANAVTELKSQVQKSKVSDVAQDGAEDLKSDLKNVVNHAKQNITNIVNEGSKIPNDVA